VCECGCGFEGEDEVTQWLIEEAAFMALDIMDAREQRKAFEEQASESRLTAMAMKALGH